MSETKKRLIVNKKKVTLPKFNTASDCKVGLRRDILEELGVPEPAVLDVYGGPGVMWEKAYGKTKNYVGVDERLYLDQRAMVKCDNVDFLRAAELDNFDVFDLDAAGVLSRRKTPS